MNIAIIDRYPMLRFGVINAVGDYFPKMGFVEFESIESMEVRAAKINFELIILGTGQDAGCDDLTAVKKLKELWPDANLIVYDEKLELTMISQYFAAGTHGYISKQAAPAELIECIQQVLNHQIYVNEQIVDSILRRSVTNRNRSDHILTLLENQDAKFPWEEMD